MPGQPQPGIPMVSRLDRGVAFAVREKGPYSLTASIDKAILQQGDKATAKVTLVRLWPDNKAPLTLQAQIADLPPNNTLTFQNNQPVTIAADKTEGTLAVEAKSNCPPGTYNVVFHTQAQVPFNKDPMAKQKPATLVVLPSTPLKITVLPKSVGSLSLATPNPSVKVGMETEIVVKITRQFDYAGEFKVQVVVPAAAKGLATSEATISAGKDEVKLVLKAAPDTAIGAKPDLIARATAVLAPNVTATQDVKFSVNVVK